MIKYVAIILMIVVTSMTTMARAAPLDMNIWLSGSAVIPGGTFLGEVPALTAAPGSINNQFQIWARPEAGKTLRNWSFNLNSTDPNVIDFTGIVVYNPTVIFSPFGDQKRWEFTTNGSISAPNPDQIDGFSGFTVIGPAAGIGPSTTSLDPSYDGVEDAWLLATVFYNAMGAGTTELYLQIGANGINHDGESSSQTDVIFGALTDPSLNGDAERSINSLTADATINVVPLPATVWLFGSGLIGLIGVVRKKAT